MQIGLDILPELSYIYLAGETWDFLFTSKGVAFRGRAHDPQQDQKPNGAAPFTFRRTNMTKRENRWRERSRTYPGIAQAMAEQWG